MLRSTLLAAGLVATFPLCTAQRTCNNSPELCDRSYNNITYLGAHDSPFVREAANNYTIFGNQYYDSITQLDAGVRLLTGQVHQNGGSWDLCHSACAFLNAGSLTAWLSEIKVWLDNHPDEVVTILLVNANDADAETLDQQFRPANIVDYAYVPPSTTSATGQWPTLNEMIDQNKRLVVWIASLDPNANTVAPYLLDQFTFVFENNYDISDPADFGCDPDRPTNLRGQPIDSVLSSGYLPLMNHFLYNRINSITYPAEDKIDNTNAASGAVGNLGDSANNCTSYYGKAPTYILVDFFNVARAIDTVDRLNGISGQTSGRAVLPETVDESKADSVSTTTTSSAPVSVTPTTSAPTSVPTRTSSTTPGSAVTTIATPGAAGPKYCKRSKAKWAAGGAAMIAMV